MTIEPFEPAFLTEAARIYVRVFGDKPWHQRWTYEDARKRLSDVCKTPGFFGLAHLSADERLDGFVLGHVEQWTQARRFWLREMAVETRWQREGIGAALLRELHSAMPALGVTSCHLVTSTQPPADYFAKHGYAPDGARQLTHVI